MSDIAVGGVGLVIAITIMLLGIPIGLSFFTGGIIGLALLLGIDKAVTVMAAVPYDAFHNYNLMAIPMFILMGYACMGAGISQGLYDFANKWLGQLHGGLAIATIGACAMFSAVTGSSLACAGAVGSIALPEMARYKYSRALAAGCVAAGGTLGILIPPSLAFIWIGVLTSTNISKLFIAGILPGCLLTFIYMLGTYLIVRANPSLGPAAQACSWKERFTSVKSTWMMIVLFVLVIGGIYFGVFTPTEAGAIGVLGAFALAIVTRKMSRQMLVNSLSDTGHTVVSVLMILLGAMVFNTFIALSKLPYWVSNSIISLNLPPYWVLVIIILLYIPLGMFLDTLAMIVLTVPIFFPVAVSLGFDPIWFAVIVVIMNEAALITPPVGMNVFIVAGISKTPMGEVFKGILPYFLMQMLTVVLIILFPSIVLFLPGLMS